MGEEQQGNERSGSSEKVDDAVSVGEDLGFQKSWWKFEQAVWILFVMILVADVLGVFGRGYFAHAQLKTPDDTMYVKYERVERASTPSIMTVTFGPEAVSGDEVQLLVSRSVIQKLGNQRISPQPARSVLTPEGILYHFPVTSTPVVIEFALEPSFPGVQHMSLQVPGHDPVQARIVVVP